MLSNQTRTGVPGALLVFVFVLSDVSAAGFFSFLSDVAGVFFTFLRSGDPGGFVDFAAPLSVAAVAVADGTPVDFADRGILGRTGMAAGP